MPAICKNKWGTNENICGDPAIPRTGSISASREQTQYIQLQLTETVLIDCYLVFRMPSNSILQTVQGHTKCLKIRIKPETAKQSHIQKKISSSKSHTLQPLLTLEGSLGSKAESMVVKKKLYPDKRCIFFY